MAGAGDAEVERHPADGWRIEPFRDPAAFEKWLAVYHGTEPGVWLKFAKKTTRIPSVTLPQAKEVAMCFGWVDSKMLSYDAAHYVLRYQPRRRRSRWSPGNRALAERLIAEGRMRPAGLAAVRKAQEEGMW